MRERLVSVVMPVYQKEAYVEECIRSILNQTYREIELICIDDASCDKSGDILKRLADEDSRIKIITNDINKGAAISRNIGLETAQGKYVSVLDADDFADSELIERAVLCCEQNQLDILLYDYCTYYHKSGKKAERHMPLAFREILKNKCVFSSHDIEEFSFQMCTASGCTKLYNREFIEKNHIRFQSLSSANEALFNRLAVVCAERIGYEKACWWNYRIGIENQITNQVNEHSLNYAKMGAALKEELIMRGLYERNKKSFHTYVFKCVMSYFQYADGREDYCRQIKERLLETIGDGEGAFLSPYYEYWYRDFMNQTCYDDINDSFMNEYQYIFRYEKSKAEQLKSYIREKKYKTALWGYGKNGKAFFQECGENDFPIDIIVDSNSKDSMVSSPDVLQKGKYIVLVASAELVEDIYKRARQLEGCTWVIDVQSFFSYGVELEKCIFDSAGDIEGTWM